VGRALVVIALAACNQVYGLDPTIERDARFFDAPSTCPPIGGPINFGPLLEQAALDYYSYTASRERAIVLRGEPLSANAEIHGGPPDGPFALIPELPRSEGAVFYITRAQLSPEGDLLLLRVGYNGASALELRTYHFDGAWVRGANVDAAPYYTTTVSRAPDRRMIGRPLNDSVVRELSDVSGTWQEIATHPLAGVTNVAPLWLSPDALRLVFNASGIIRYSDRASTADPFVSSQVLELPSNLDTFITEDCTRAYFSGLQSLFYANRR